MICHKDIIYFEFKKIINDTDYKYYNVVQIYTKFYNMGDDIINHFNQRDLSLGWWNRTHYYLFYSIKVYNMINQIIYLEKSNKDDVKFIPIGYLEKPILFIPEEEI